MEKLEVVDRKNRVVGRASRRAVHRLGLMHRAVHIFVFDGRDRLYLQRRSMRKDQYPGHWDSSAAGHVDPGESYERCAQRELWEELGVTADLRRLAHLPASAQTGWEHVEWFMCRTDAPLRLAPAEIDTGGFFSQAEIERWLQSPEIPITPAFRHLFALWSQLARHGPGQEEGA